MPDLSFLPQMMSLSDVVDKFAKSRMAQAQFERQQAADAAKDAYYRGRNELADRRQDSIDAAGRAKHNAEQQRMFIKAPGSGPVVVYDKRGNMRTINPRYEGDDGQPDALGAEQPSVPQLPAPHLTMPEPSIGPKPEPMVPQLRVPSLPGPVPPQPAEPQAQRNTVFLDENDEGDTRALMGPQDSETRQLPIDAFPPGAREGQRFDAADVNLRGGKGNPFAEPVEPAPMPQSETQQVPGGRLDLNAPEPPQSAHTPPRTVQAFKGSMQPGRRWVVDLPDGEEPWVVDLDQQSKARESEKRDRLQQLDSALLNPDLDDDDKKLFKKERALIVSGLSPSVAMEYRKERARQRQIEADGERREGLEGVKFENAKTMEGIKQGNRVALKKTPRGGAGGSAISRARSTDPTAGEGNPWANTPYKERERMATRLDRELRDWTMRSGWTKLLSTNIGRLEWAATNISVTGPNAGAAQVEAMQNLFGAARGGTPVKNETDEFYKGTRTIQSTVDSIGAAIGLPQLGTRLASGEFLSKEDREKYAKGYSSLPSRQRDAIEEAIKSTQDALLKYGRREINGLKTMWDAEPLAFRYKATAHLNEMGSHIGLEPRQWWPDVPLKGGGKQPADGQPGAAPAGGGQAPLSREEFLKALQGMK